MRLDFDYIHKMLLEIAGTPEDQISLREAPLYSAILEKDKEIEEARSEQDRELSYRKEKEKTEEKEAMEKLFFFTLRYLQDAGCIISGSDIIQEGQCGKIIYSCTNTPVRLSPAGHGLLKSLDMGVDTQDAAQSGKSPVDTVYMILDLALKSLPGLQALKDAF